jgi:hypothetical protein
MSLSECARDNSGPQLELARRGRRRDNLGVLPSGVRAFSAAEQAETDEARREELLALKHENERPRKSLALLCTYSLNLQEQRDTV